MTQKNISVLILLIWRMYNKMVIMTKGGLWASVISFPNRGWLSRE